MKLEAISAVATTLALSFLTTLPASVQASTAKDNLISSNVQGRVLLASAQRVNFAPNTTGADLDGTLQASQHRDYVLRARAGQRLTMGTIGTSGFLVQVFAPNGRLIHSSGENASVRLPSTGDYHIRISLPPGQQSSEMQQYKLSISVQ